MASVKRRREVEEKSLMMVQGRLEWEKERAVRDDSRFERTNRVAEQRLELDEARVELKREECKANRQKQSKTLTFMDAILAKLE